jgi:N-acetylmuramoyl-L-alanine amidase
MKRVMFLLGMFLLALGSSFGQTLKPLDGITIMLDPGHGGADPGAVGPNGLKESVVNLRVARYLATLLKHDGARVLMTRMDDTFISLAGRVASADAAVPDLFVSIHHNASLAPKREHRGEIYFNAVDQGIPLDVAREMTAAIAGSPLASGSVTLPGGFFVLRNNTVPAILTEASYLSVPDNAKALSTGRALVDEAFHFRNAIRKAFKRHPLRVSIFSPRPCRVNTPFFHVLLSAAEPLAHLQLNVQGPGSATFKLDRLPGLGNLYSLTSQASLPTGDYLLTMSFFGRSGAVSARQILPLQVRLPFQKCLIRTAAPFIPRGFKGGFPVEIALMDFAGRPNPGIVPVIAKWEGKDKAVVTNADGHACVVLDLNGNERGNLQVVLTADEQEIGRLFIPVRENDGTFILGRVSCGFRGTGLENVKIHHGLADSTITGPGGYFFCRLPSGLRNLKIELVPPLGYQPTTKFIQGFDQRLLFPEFVLQPLAPKILGKHYGLIIHRDDEEHLRRLVRQVMQRGGKITRMQLPPEAMKPETVAVAQANTLADLEFLITTKSQSGKELVLRHYHRGGRGLILAQGVQGELKKRGIKAVVQPGSDYEISHSNAAAMVMDIPGTTEAALLGSIYEALGQVLETGW